LRFDPSDFSSFETAHSRALKTSGILTALSNPKTSLTNLTIPAPIPARSNAKVIGRNFIFIGLELVITLVCTLLTTVAIARVIGPTKLGYFNLIFWLTSITSAVGSLGIPLTTFKYMGEFLGGGQKELARAVFFYNLWAQTAISCALTVIGMVAVFTVADPAYRLCSILLVLSMIPNMITFVPSQANSAAEDASLNTRGAFVGALVYVVAVAVSLWLGWNLVGIAAGVLLYRTAELAVKTVPVLRSMKSVPRVPLPREIRKRMFSFSGLSTGLMILQIVIWDRSDIIFLKLLQPDIRPLAAATHSYRETSTACVCGTRKSTRHLNDEPTGVGSKAENCSKRRRSSFCSTANMRLVTRKTIAPAGTATLNFMRGSNGIATIPRTTAAIARVAAASLSTTGPSIRTG